MPDFELRCFRPQTVHHTVNVVNISEFSPSTTCLCLPLSKSADSSWHCSSAGSSSELLKWPVLSAQVQPGDLEHVESSVAAKYSSPNCNIVVLFF